MRGLWALLLSLGLVVEAAPAQVYAIDTDQAQAGFWIRPIWFKRIEGTFPILEGVATHLGEDGAMEVDVRIDVRALQMSRTSYVNWAQSEEFFDTQRHPWIRFRSEPVLPWQLHQGGAVQGWLTLRGITHAMSIELEPGGCARPGFDCLVQATGEVSRSDFGMDAKKRALGDTVHLAFSVRLRETPLPAVEAEP